jgi:hypothetical protein
MDLVRIRVASFLFFLSGYEPEDVYNMDETRLYLRAYHNKTLARGKVKGRKLQKKRVTLAFAIDSTGTYKLKLLVIYTSKPPRCFGRWQPHEYVRWHSNKQLGWKGVYLRLRPRSLTISSKAKIEMWLWFWIMHLYMSLALPKLVSLVVFQAWNWATWIWSSFLPMLQAWFNLWTKV